MAYELGSSVGASVTSAEGAAEARVKANTARLRAARERVRAALERTKLLASLAALKREVQGKIKIAHLKLAEVNIRASLVKNEETVKALVVEARQLVKHAAIVGRGVPLSALEIREQKVVVAAEKEAVKEEAKGGNLMAAIMSIGTLPLAIGAAVVVALVIARRK